MGSANSLVAFPGKTSYTTAKHAVIGITKTGGELFQYLLMMTVMMMKMLTIKKPSTTPPKESASTPSVPSGSKDP